MCFAPVGLTSALSCYLFLRLFIHTLLFVYTKITAAYCVFQSVPDPMEDVKKDIETVRSQLSHNTVAHALGYLRQFLSHPPGAPWNI